MKLASITRMSVLTLGLAIGSSAWAASPSTQPASPTLAANQLELRANEDMAKGDYASALPLLEQASQLVADHTDQLAPVLEQIRVCRRQMKSPTAAAPAALTPAMQAVTAAMAPSERIPHPALKPGEKLVLPIKELGNFDYDAQNGGNIPDDVKKLEGCHFQTSGYMVPLDQAEAITNFALVPSLFSCCYGQPPQIQHTLVVTCPKGKAVSYFPDAITVEGTLHVSEQKDGGFIVSIFQIDATSVRASDK